MLCCDGADKPQDIGGTPHAYHEKQNSFEYDLDSILSRLLYGRILYPSFKLSCHEQSKELLEAPNFDLHHVYRALSVLSENSDLIQAELYKRSKAVIKSKRCPCIFAKMKPVIYIIS